MKAPVILAAALLLPLVAVAGEVQFTTKILEILAGDEDAGGCQARTSVNPVDRLATCGNAWVSFDCAGLAPGASKSLNANKLSSAQLAYVTDRNVRIMISDTPQVNGRCRVVFIRNQ